MERSERKERECQSRRAEVLRQAERIFSAKGFRAATMAEIAGASGYAIGTIYQIFEGKEHLYTTMVNEKIERMFSCIREAVGRADTVKGKIEALVAAHFRFVEDNADFCRLFVLGESMALPEGITRLNDKMIANYLDHSLFIEDFIARGIESGDLKPMEPKAAASALLGMINAFTFNCVVTPGGTPLSAAVGVVMDIFLKGVAGHEY